jgi:hypothetical protein
MLCVHLWRGEDIGNWILILRCVATISWQRDLVALCVGLPEITAPSNTPRTLPKAVSDGLQRELEKDVALARANGLSHANLPDSFCNRDQHVPKTPSDNLTLKLPSLASAHQHG